MSNDPSYVKVTRQYEQARTDFFKGFREYLIERGIRITSPDHEQAERSNYNLAHHEELTALEQLGVDWSAARAAQECRVIEANELAAQAHDTNARWARMMDDRLAKEAKG